MFQDQTYSGALKDSLLVEPNGSECKRKGVRIVKLVKGRYSFASDVRLRNSKNYLQNVFRSILENPSPFTPRNLTN